MNFTLTDEQEKLKNEFDTFFETEMKDAPGKFLKNTLEATYCSDECFAFHNSMQRKIAKKGWLTMAWPKEYGGQDAPIIDQLLFNESLAHYSSPGIDIFGMKMFAPAVMLFASDEQKARILPPIANGEVSYCQGWSEPNAGSDLASLKTSAVKDGEYYVINGQKIWTTGAHRADHMFLLARTDPSEKRGRGLSVFNVEDMRAPGIEVRPIQYMNGGHMYNEVYFTDVRIHESNLIGKENDGWAQTRATMNFERSGVGVFVSVKHSLGELVEYAKTTIRDGKPIIEDPIVRQKIAKLYIDVEIGRALAYRCAWEQQKGNMIVSTTMASESKVFGSELAQRLSYFATEIMGLHGQLETCAWSPMDGNMIDSYTWCMGSNIAAGTSEIQRNLIAWVGLGLPRFN
ncbi:MAG: acyl-CoA dehydrogenase [Candidatus Hydrogenedentota bacterium]|nr:MAG: acyl-CoA dehydrogenase [Candidatus Hydrogenedentota bacterium]PCJ60481.1 MAG: acyl-CoA dehydrogenase [Candidatus Hydrogenedentota bacterium]